MPRKVTKIPETTQQRSVVNQQLRVAIYYRASTKYKGQQQSLATPIGYYTNYNQNHPNWVMVAMYWKPSIRILRSGVYIKISELTSSLPSLGPKASFIARTSNLASVTAWEAGNNNLIFIWLKKSMNQLSTGRRFNWCSGWREASKSSEAVRLRPSRITIDRKGCSGIR